MQWHGTGRGLPPYSDIFESIVDGGTGNKAAGAGRGEFRVYGAEGKGASIGEVGESRLWLTRQKLQPTGGPRRCGRFYCT